MPYRVSLSVLILSAALGWPTPAASETTPGPDVPAEHADRSKSDSKSSKSKTTKSSTRTTRTTKSKTTRKRDSEGDEESRGRAIPESRTERSDRSPTRSPTTRSPTESRTSRTPTESRTSRTATESRPESRPTVQAGSTPRERRTSYEAARVRRPSTTSPRPSTTSRSVRTLHRSSDHRFARPRASTVRLHHEAPRPVVRWYRPWYTHWWVHPWYRWVHATSAVRWFDFEVYAWSPAWIPPTRPGWTWIPGYHLAGTWIPGHWRPVRTAPVYAGAAYVWVPGFWIHDAWFEGYWRIQTRPGWVWLGGEYWPDGYYQRGYWAPTSEPPGGYVWEPGVWDGEEWADGFWRPEHRIGFRWVSSAFDEDGTFHAGYWEPIEQKPGQVWIPGWFDGQTWQEGYWVPEPEYEAADPAAWQPEEGWDDGWDVNDDGPPSGDPPLALPARDP